MEPTPLAVADRPTCAPHGPAPPAVRLDGVTVRLGGATVLDGVDLAIPAGVLVAVAGGSGAGKTTLLEVVAGLRRPERGTVARAPGPVGVVPQDDIIHRDLPLRRTLVHAARLRLPREDQARAADVVDEVLDTLGLADRAGVRVGSLSGGQRKRASIAVELLTHPAVLLLDEPTSGLDPSSAAEVIGVLGRLAARGTTVVVATHHPADIEACDHLVFLAPGGRVAHSGPVGTFLEAVGVDRVADAYGAVAGRLPPRLPGHPPPTVDPPPAADRGPATVHLGPERRSVGAPPLRQWSVLTVRAAEVMVRNRLTVAILVGSPAMVIAMMAVLFPAGGFDGPAAGAAGPSQTLFWMAFSAFFFGLTYGLLQIVTERAVLRRERFSGLGLGAYLASKVAVLTPVLVGVVAALLVVLRLSDRLPATGVGPAAELALTLVLTALAGLAVGLAASAAVADPTQATLALPMICFPQVLFAGAVVPVDQMAGAGAATSVAMVTRWSFESLGRTLLPTAASAPGSTADPYREAFAGSPAAGWWALVAVVLVASIASVAVLRRRTARAGLGAR